ncbi:TPA: diphthine synthase [Thermoplasmata archaeon]|nr:diphthine synthase [Thermoplasmata archaeon]
MPKGLKGRLALVGLGLHDDRDVTARGLDEIADADIVFSESYTSRLSEGSVSRLSERLGKEIRFLDRTAVEDASVILDACDGHRVVLLVAGDPLTATTHVDLRLRAARGSIETVVVHAPSVLTAVPGALGLQHYKFGRTTTLPYPQEGYLPTSPCEMVLENLARGLHTLVLLDIDAENERYMSANEGMRLLLEMARKMDAPARAISDDTLVCVVARAGAPDCVVSAGKLGEMRLRDFGPPLHTIVIPGKLHFMERDALETFAGAVGLRE